ncbi:YdiU family protein [Paenibacillus jamilae]|uniref:Protein nucleotidyltransferase YdiU n=1 Tax=Bacillus thuringiensis serovar subtoxicus TaxID=475791 RepID=A0A9X6II23_BACTU|nr:protein adenylyltransferase SelO [Bacillus thuringiensis]MEB4840923.1 YdiU family protein [Paenibacillus jamilae]MEB8579145.1 YdiU family protein [Bacillus cereus]MCR6852958.1 YdiU family protein [Bacillus thuringiensis]MDR4283677.1 YdiU family protein [Bacillus thuringiensis]MEB8596510.1 YdiU family protein [Bacillus cereus]
MTKNNETGWNLDNSYTTLPQSFYTEIPPTPVSSPELVKLNHSLAISLGLTPEELKKEAEIAIFAGNALPEGAHPLAQAYAGHQFGHFNMLGDGRALLIGEQITPSGERFDIQLKGSGPTPYSRRGDGRAALGPMLREYIISEAMYALDIPTTRSLAVVTTGEPTYRETKLPGAILTRVASSHIRVGTFQYAALLQEVIKRQASLIAKWQLVGFIHGVMNTDNITISGETIDYGPCAFMDNYDQGTVFSSIDTQGRYAYGNQPYMAAWDLARLAESLIPILHEDEEEALKIAQDEISKFSVQYEKQWFLGMKKKLGLFSNEEQDHSLIEQLLKMMEKYKADYTNTFRSLTLDAIENTALFESPEFKEWYKLWQSRLDRQEQLKENAYEMMKNNNPSIIPRNHRVEEALEAAVTNDDYSVMEKLLEALSNPYAYSTDQEEYCAPPAPTNRPYRTFCGT